MGRDDPIEVLPERDGWIVRHRGATLGAFAAETCAVTYARGLADTLVVDGARPRILVRLTGRPAGPMQ